MKMIIYKENWIRLFIVFTLASCSIRPSGGGGKSSGDKYVMTFFRGNDEWLYFFKPMRFSSEQVELETDFTFIKRGDSIVDSITMNYSVYCNVDLSSQGLKTIYIDSTSIAIGKLIFSEVQKKTFKTRYSTKIGKDVLSKLTDKSSIRLHTSDHQFQVYPNSNFTKKSLLKMAQF